MGKGQAKPVRRLRLVPGRASHSASHSASPSPEPVQPPRVEALEALLREVDGLRLTLETDLTLAAAAVESGIPTMASEILGNDRDALRRFEERALGHLAELATPPRRRSVWAQAHAAPIVAAAALIGVLAGVVPQLAGPTDNNATTVAATDSLERLQELAAQGDTEQVRAASAELHRQLAGVVANANADPAAAQTALMLLTYEQSAIVRSGDRALEDVLRQSQALARAIVAQLPSARSARPSVPPVKVAADEPSSSPRPKPKPSPSASTRTQTASASPSASPSPSGSRGSDGYPLPSPPVAP